MAIERKAKRSPFLIEHQRDWYQLVRLAENKNKCKMIGEQKGPLVKKYFDNENRKFDYREIKWLRYTKHSGN